MIKKPIVALINFYQLTISPDHSTWGKQRYPNGYCKYYPSCSEYARQSIYNNGIVKGLALSFWRIIRCNPLSKGGIDYV